MTPAAARPPTRVRLWRWRRNPLRRRTDVVEAWTVAVTWILAILVGGLAGVWAGQSVETGLSARTARLHAVSAVVTDGSAAAADSGGSLGTRRVRAPVRWTDARGEVHPAAAQVVAGTAAGSRVTVWTDPADRVVPTPVTGDKAMLQAVLTGVLVCAAAAGAAGAAGWAVRARLMRRRMADWDEEWKRVGPQWGNLSGGRG
ncbi:hypothetical protein ACGFS9_11090 [Streptomyces sp. NPDC048566]|uniref:Rv1733c family protein n=1 Tax=Streptomyces sp. NPDC048566 TaxID=3365569 RepID=UPI0037143413